MLNGMESTGCEWLELVQRRIIFAGHGRREGLAELGARVIADDGRYAGSVVDYSSLWAKHASGTIERRREGIRVLVRALRSGTKKAKKRYSLQQRQIHDEMAEGMGVIRQQQE